MVLFTRMLPFVVTVMNVILHNKMKCVCFVDMCNCHISRKIPYRENVLFLFLNWAGVKSSQCSGNYPNSCHFVCVCVLWAVPKANE